MKRPNLTPVTWIYALRGKRGRRYHPRSHQCPHCAGRPRVQLLCPRLAGLPGPGLWSARRSRLFFSPLPEAIGGWWRYLDGFRAASCARMASSSKSSANSSKTSTTPLFQPMNCSIGSNMTGTAFLPPCSPNAAALSAVCTAPIVRSKVPATATKSPGRVVDEIEHIQKLKKHADDHVL